MSTLMPPPTFTSAIGTAVGNPWTFPFIWAAIYRTGAFILGDVDSAQALGDYQAAKRVLNKEWSKA